MENMIPLIICQKNKVSIFIQLFQLFLERIMMNLTKL